MRLFFLAALSVALAAAASANAQSTHSVAVAGVGRDACATWLTDRGATSGEVQATTKQRIEWLSGFLSGVNLFADRSGDLKGGADNIDGALEWIDTYCRAHPSDPLFAAAAGLVFDLRNHPR
jgi:hypothetical protein